MQATTKEIMATVHEMTEKFQVLHHDDTFDEVVALTAKARSGTLALLSELSDDQISERIPGAPWSDGTVGGVLGANAAHGRISRVVRRAALHHCALTRRPPQP